MEQCSHSLERERLSHSCLNSCLTVSSKVRFTRKVRRLSRREPSVQIVAQAPLSSSQGTKYMKAVRLNRHHNKALSLSSHHSHNTHRLQRTTRPIPRRIYAATALTAHHEYLSNARYNTARNVWEDADRSSRNTGDLSHLASIFILLAKMKSSSVCASNGSSGRWWEYVLTG